MRLLNNHSSPHDPQEQYEGQQDLLDQSGRSMGKFPTSRETGTLTAQLQLHKQG